MARTLPGVTLINADKRETRLRTFSLVIFLNLCFALKQLLFVSSSNKMPFGNSSISEGKKELKAAFLSLFSPRVAHKVLGLSATKLENSQLS